MATITISGITYNVIASKPFSHNGSARRELRLQRLNGRRFYFATMYENGSVSEAA